MLNFMLHFTFIIIIRQNHKTRNFVLSTYYFIVPWFHFFDASFSFLSILLLGFRVLLGLNNSFSIASMKSSKLLPFVSFDRNNLDVTNFFLGGFGITLILPAVGGCNKNSCLDVMSVVWVTLQRNWLKNLAKSLLTSYQLISDGVGTNDGPLRKSDFCDSDSSIDVKLIAFWSGTVSLTLAMFCFCLSLLILLFSLNLASQPSIFLRLSFYN